MGYKQRGATNLPQFVHPLAKKILSECKSIVDIGCDIGRLANVFPSAKLIGVDIRPDACLCLERGYAEFHQMDIENSPLPYLAADGMIISHVLEHILHPHIALSNALKSLAPRTCVYITAPTLANAAYWDDYTHIHPFTEVSVVNLMEDCGLTHIELLYLIQAPFRGAGRIFPLFTHNDKLREHQLAHRFRLLRSAANVHAIGYTE